MLTHYEIEHYEIEHLKKLNSAIRLRGVDYVVDYFERFFKWYDSSIFHRSEQAKNARILLAQNARIEQAKCELKVNIEYNYKLYRNFL